MSIVPLRGAHTNIYDHCYRVTRRALMGEKNIVTQSCQTALTNLVTLKKSHQKRTVVVNTYYMHELRWEFIKERF